MEIAAIVLKVLLTGLFGMAGYGKVAGVQREVDNFDAWLYPQSFRPVVGYLELIGAAAILLAIWVPWLGVGAAAWLGGTMLGALYTHLIRAPKTRNGAVANVVLGGMAAAVLALELAIRL
jgi:putative oxidoreductase